MFEDVSTYSPEEVYLTFGGYMVEGWETITVSRSSREYKTIKGIRGKNTRVKDPNNHAVITVVCHQTSMVNQVMSDIVALDRTTEGVRLEVSLIDGNGWEVFTSEEAYVEGTPERAYSANLGTREWKIECLTSRWNDVKRGGDSSSIFSALSSLF